MHQWWHCTCPGHKLWVDGGEGAEVARWAKHGCARGAVVASSTGQARELPHIAIVKVCHINGTQQSSRPCTVDY
jgi:hypothetical protein